MLKREVHGIMRAGNTVDSGGKNVFLVEVMKEGPILDKRVRVGRP